MSNEGNLAYGLPPDISRLLYTNDPRVDYQVAEIANSLGIARTLKDRLGLQITQMRMDLMRLEREELHATRHISRCEFALAPIRRIPTEILSEIFLCYVDLLGDKHECMDVKHGVWLLAHICSYWRVVALSTPELWTSCNFTCERACKNAHALVRSWLHHAGNRPLSIRFHCETDTPEHRRQGRCLTVIGEFVAHCSQWSEIEFLVPAKFYSHLEMDSFRHNIPILRKLRIIAALTEVDPLPVLALSLLTPFTIAPQLCDVSLVDFNLWPVRVLLPWSQITSYSGAVVAKPDIFQTAPGLLECTFLPCRTSGTTPSLRLEQPFVHFHLRHLHLHSESLRPELLTLPALQSLRISAWDISILQSLERLLQRSMASPTSLHIDEFLPSSELIAVLAAAPSITHLKVCTPATGGPMLIKDTTDRFFTRFMEGEENTPPVLPALRALSVQGFAFGETFVRMVEARCLPPDPEAENKWEGARLESLAVSDVRDTHISHILRLKKLETEAGLKFFTGTLSATRILG